MDIPDTGAVFTLGKSYLSAEDNHSYFFIKNDAVKNLVAGSYQSAVICDSGRLFVWGKNDEGQLGIPNNPQLQQKAITRPSCVKAYKSLGIKIQSIAFGDKFSVTISLDNRVHVCGKNIGIDHCDWKPIEIIEFKILADDELLAYTDVQAGNDFFIVLTNCGKAYGYGSNKFNQISKSCETTMFLTNPERIEIPEHIKQIVCVETKSLFVTDTNEIYVFNRTVANRIEFDDDIIEYINYNQNNNYVYLICESGSYLSELTAKVKSDDFRRLNLFDADPECNQIQMITFGKDNSLSFTTRSGRFFTNYDRKMRGDEFHEIKKFLSMRIINVSSGAYHILAHALPNLKPLGRITEEKDVRMNVSRGKRVIVPMPVPIPPHTAIKKHDDKLNDEQNENKMDEKIEDDVNTKISAESENENKVDDNMNKMVEETKNPIDVTEDEPAEKEDVVDLREPKIENTTEIITEEHKDNEDIMAVEIDNQTKMADSLSETKVMTDVINKADEINDHNHTLIKAAIGTAATTLAAGTVAAPIISSVLKKTSSASTNDTEMDENHNHIPPNQAQNHLDLPEKPTHEESTSETDTISDVSFPGSECTVKFRENPETINSADTNPGSTELDQQISEHDMQSINNAVNLVRVKTFAESKLSESSTAAVAIIDTKKNEIYNVIQTSDGQVTQIELVQRRPSDEGGENQMSTAESHDIRFIDNGIDVTDDIKKTEEKKMSARLLRLKNSKVAPVDQIPPQRMEDELLGEKTPVSFQTKESVRDSKFETQQKLREQFESPDGHVPSKPRKPKTPMPIKSRHFAGSINNSDDDDDEEDDDADCRTTASATSTKDTKHSSKKHSISNTSLSKVATTTTTTKKSQNFNDDIGHDAADSDPNDNKVKKFFRNIKDSSCKKIDNIRSADGCMNPDCNCLNPPVHEDIRATATEAATNQIESTQKKSKICNIL